MRGPTPPSLAFIHIPKTAGVSLSHFLQSHYAPADVLPPHDLGGLIPLGFDRLREFRLIRGHFHLPLLRKFLGEEPPFITMVRDPVDRFISNWAHHLREPGAWVPGGRARFERMTLAEFVDDEEMRGLRMHEAHARFLAGYPPPLRWPELSPGVQPEGDELAREACAAIDRSLFVGVVERWSESIELLCDVMRWDVPPVIQRRNEAPQRPGPATIDPAVRARIAEVSAVDTAVYRHAVSVFEKRLQAMRRRTGVAVV